VNKCEARIENLNYRIPGNPEMSIPGSEMH
jgi:hypothetical protein